MGECGHGFFSGGCGAGNGGAGTVGGSDGSVPAAGAGACAGFNGPLTPQPESAVAMIALAVASAKAARRTRMMNSLGIERES
jgi:hypothetical protein